MFREEQLELSEKLMAVLTSCASTQESLQLTHKVDDALCTALLTKIGVIYLQQIRSPENFIEITLPAPKSNYTVLNKTTLVGTDNYPEIVNREAATKFIKALQVKSEQEHLIPLSTIRDVIASPKSSLAFIGRDLYAIDETGTGVWYSLQNKVDIPVFCAPTKATRAIASLLSVYIQDDCFVSATIVGSSPILKFIAPTAKITVAVVCGVNGKVETKFNCAGKEMEIVGYSNYSFKEIKERDNMGMEKITLDSLQKNNGVVEMPKMEEVKINKPEQTEKKEKAIQTTETVAVTKDEPKAVEEEERSTEEFLEQAAANAAEIVEIAKVLCKTLKQASKQHKKEVKAGGSATKLAEVMQDNLKLKKALAAFTN